MDVVRLRSKTPFPSAAFLAGNRIGDVSQFYESLIAGIADGLVIQDRDGRVVHTNETAALAVGFPSVAAFVAATPDECRERFSVFDEQGEPVDLEQFPGFAVLRGEATYERVVRINVFATGQEFWTAVRSAPVLDQSGRLIVAVSSFRKLDDRPTVNLERARLSAILENSRDAIITTTADGLVHGWNPAAERLFGYTATEALGMTLARLMRADRAGERSRVLEAIRGGTRVDLDETEWLGKGRRRIDVSVSVSPMHGPSGELLGATTVARDLTDWKWLQSQYRQAQRLEALGRLAGGIAHDFNNLVTVISGFSELLLMQLNPADSRRDLVEEIARAGDRASALTRQLLVFSRHQVVAAHELNLNDIVAEAEKMLRRLIGEDIEFISDLGPNLGHIVADEGQMEQVVVNLVVNARDAMPGGGTLTVKTSNAIAEEVPGRGRPPARSGPHVVLTVTDTGIGMDQETMARIFEPFFTTKPLDRGTGLGLSTVQGIVKQCGGHIQVESEPGHGTTFRVLIPRVDSKKSSLAVAAAPTKPLGGSESVLLVEDDLVVRSLVSQVLAAQGYDVLETASGEDAQRIVAGYGKPIQLLVTDVVLPGQGGRIIFEKLKAIQPSLKVLFLSGYGENVIVRHGMLPADAPFLQKPFIPSVLVRTVRDVLDGE